MIKIALEISFGHSFAGATWNKDSSNLNIINLTNPNQVGIRFVFAAFNISRKANESIEDVVTKS